VGIRLAFRTGTCVGGLFSPISEILVVKASSGDTLAILRKSRLFNDSFDMFLCT
jgi:hypothetical protein